MAQAPRETGNGGSAEFVRNVVSDPKNVPDVMLLTGYAGASSEEGHERLYLSPDLSSYVEIPRTAILHQAALPKEQDAHGGVTVWVKKDAALQYKMAPAAQAMANYFAGAIRPARRAGWRQRASRVASPTPTAIPTHFTPCIPTRFQPQCPYPTEICTHVGACPTRHPGYCPLPEAAAGAANAARAGGAAPDFIGASYQPGCWWSYNACPSLWGPCGGHHVTAPCTEAVMAAAPQAALGAHALRPDSHRLLARPCPTRIGPCLSHHFTCAPCITQHPLQCSIACPTRLEYSCNIACQITNAVDCPVASGFACPQVSLGCPEQSLACGGGFPGQQGVGAPVAQMRAFNARIGAVQATIDISYAPGCWYSYNACPSMTVGRTARTIRLAARGDRDPSLTRLPASPLRRGGSPRTKQSTTGGNRALGERRE